MSDTQWPRFEVFLQDRNGRLHKNVGSVHAADAEMALLNARDVFGRRPTCNSLWVVAAAQILAITAEELAHHSTSTIHIKQSKEYPYAIFQKQSQRRAMTYVVYRDEIMAQSTQDALQKAMAQFEDADKPTFVWWVCPVAAITKSDADDVDSLFAPALTKQYKRANSYKTFTAIRSAKADQK